MRMMTTVMRMMSLCSKRTNLPINSTSHAVVANSPLYIGVPASTLHITFECNGAHYAYVSDQCITAQY